MKFTRTKKPKRPPRDLRQEFIDAGLAAGYSEVQLRFLWDATERRPRPTGELEKEDVFGMAGFVILLAGLAGWHWQIAADLAGIAIMALAWLSAGRGPVKPKVPEKNG